MRACATNLLNGEVFYTLRNVYAAESSDRHRELTGPLQARIATPRSGCDPAGCLGFWRARSVMARAGAVERTARLKIQAPSGKGWSASISSASAATLSVLGVML
jgi:hypothetical protein